MKADEEPAHLSISPTFSSYSSGGNNLAEIATRVVREIGEEPFADAENHGWEAQGSSYRFREKLSNGLARTSAEGVRSGKNGDDEEFEFAVLCREPDASTSSAHEIFYNGQIKPVYPVFNTNLMIENGLRVETGSENSKAKSVLRRSPLRKLMNDEEFKTTSLSSPESDNLGSVPSETYCVWAPNTEKTSPGRSKKRNSSGSSNRWKLMDLIYNHSRSKTEGEDAHIMRTTSIKKNDQPRNISKAKEDSRSTIGLTTSTSSKSGFTSFSLHNARLGRNRTVKEPEKKRSFLPHRKHLL